MLAQAEKYGARREEKRVIHLEKNAGGFVVGTDGATYRARSVLLASGVVNRRPEGMADPLHDEALSRGLLRYCPVCDGYEVTDTRVAVIGTGRHGCDEAEFIRTYTKDITLVSPLPRHDLDDSCDRKLRAAGIDTVEGPVANFAIEGDCLAFNTAQGRMKFASVYPALGSDIRSELAGQAGAELSAEGCVKVGDHLETSVPGLFAAGDVVIGLDQISHAMGQAGVAATTIRHHLAAEEPLRR